MKMDPSRYATTMVDLAMGEPVGGPSWANLNFLEPDIEKPNADPKDVLKGEIDKIR